MRTTITLDERLLRAAKRLAAARGVTLSEIIAEALRLQLASGRPRDRPSFKLVTFRGEGPHPGVDLDRTSELELLDDEERFRRAGG
jgi:hypothetical protein